MSNSEILFEIFSDLFDGCINDPVADGTGIRISNKPVTGNGKSLRNYDGMTFRSRFDVEEYLGKKEGFDVRYPYVYNGHEFGCIERISGSMTHVFKYGN